ncbi:MAG: dTDP-4-dehydrorhamnose reductase [Bacteroidetes bacterium]|nr:dTDP-4-dehydrorhamnose reductase [Bacteroidota bacterium]
MKVIGILGAGGQLGSELQIAFNADAENYKLVCSTSKELDITNTQNLAHFFANNKIDVLINCAAYTAVDLAEKEKELNNAINNIAVKNIADLCKKHQVFFIHISTDFVFDGTKCLPYKETDATNPLQEYGKAKLEGEQWVKEGIVVRTSWLYSGFGHNFVKTMLKLGKTKESINVVDNQIGTPTYAADLAQFLYTIINEDLYKNNTGIYHYSNEGVASWYDFAQSIMNISESNCSVFPIPDFKYKTPAKRPNYSVMDKTKVKETFNIEIPYWRTSLQDCIKILNEE